MHFCQATRPITKFGTLTKTYPPEVQDIARRAIEAAQRMDASKVANMLEPKVKSTARKVVKK